MNFNYRIKHLEIEEDIKLYIEKEFNELQEKYFFLNEKDRVHIEMEMHKDSKIEIKAEVFVSKLGKNYLSKHADESIYKVINEVKRKIDVQMLKTKEKEFTN